MNRVNKGGHITTHLTMIKEYIDRGGPVEKDGKNLVFGINRHHAWKIVRGCADKAGMGKLINPDTGRTRGISPHRLRDLFAIHAMKTNDSGDGLRLLQEHLGHSNFNTTARYRKVAGEEHREWYQGLWEDRDKSPETDQNRREDVDSNDGEVRHDS